MPKRALVASDSNVANDPRVLKQVRWLSELGWSVDTLGRGVRAPEVTGEHFAIPRRSALVRVLAYLLLPNDLKYRVLIESTVPRLEMEGAARPPYDLVVFNEIELLPWFVKRQEALLIPGGKSHLDLHEYAPSQRVGLAYRLVFKRFRDWMIEFIPHSAFSSRSVVAPGIANLYRERFDIPLPSVVRSCPDFVDQEPSAVDPERIRLVHHGVASLSRGLGLLIEAMHEIDERFSLELMLVGSKKSIDTLKRQAEPLGARVTFRKPVDVRKVASALNDYDLELIFIPPVTENLRFGLPNKLFEAVQGRLGIVLGQSPEMVALVEVVGNGALVHGWSPSDLAATVNRLTADEVARLKAHSHLAARDLSSESERQRFMQAIGLGAEDEGTKPA